jgi:hypothetical protein
MFPDGENIHKWSLVSFRILLHAARHRMSAQDRHIAVFLGGSDLLLSMTACHNAEVPCRLFSAVSAHSKLHPPEREQVTNSQYAA